MVNINARARMQSGGTQISRRSVARGMAWTVPVVAVATAAPAYASASQPVIIVGCGNACKHPGEGQNDKTYHFTFCFTNTTASSITVILTGMVVNGVSGSVSPTSVVVAANTTVCAYVDAPNFSDSANGVAVLNYYYDIVGQPRIRGSVSTAFNDLPPCGTGADPGDNPNKYPHPGAAPTKQGGC